MSHTSAGCILSWEVLGSSDYYNMLGTVGMRLPCAGKTLQHQSTTSAIMEVNWPKLHLSGLIRNCDS